MKLMSFAMTTRQMRERTKDVTRRLGWWTLQAGEIICAAEKCQGLKKGQKVVRIGPIRIVNARTEHLWDITPEELVREGFPGMSPDDYVTMFCQQHSIAPNGWVRRIEFEFV